MFGPATVHVQLTPASSRSPAGCGGRGRRSIVALLPSILRRLAQSIADFIAASSIVVRVSRVRFSSWLCGRCVPHLRRTHLGCIRDRNRTVADGNSAGPLPTSSGLRVTDDEILAGDRPSFVVILSPVRLHSFFPRKFKHLCVAGTPVKVGESGRMKTVAHNCFFNQTTLTARQEHQLGRKTREGHCISTTSMGEGVWLMA